MLKSFIEFNEDGGIIKTPGYIAIVILLIAFFAIISLVKKKDEKRRFSTKQLVFCAVCMALAFILSNVKLFKLPMGGSVTLLSMFFVTFIGYLYGPAIGITAAVSYGFLQLIVDPYVVYPLQLVFDYILAFGALGLSGFFWKSKHGLVKGYVAGILGRFVFSTLSGYLFFKEWTPEGMNPLWYTVSYNGSYIGAEGIITIILLLLPPVAGALAQVKKMAAD